MVSKNAEVLFQSTLFVFVFFLTYFFFSWMLEEYLATEGGVVKH